MLALNPTAAAQRGHWEAAGRCTWYCRSCRTCSLVFTFSSTVSRIWMLLILMRYSCRQDTVVRHKQQRQVPPGTELHHGCRQLRQIRCGSSQVHVQTCMHLRCEGRVEGEGVAVIDVATLWLLCQHAHLHQAAGIWALQNCSLWHTIRRVPRCQSNTG